MVATIYTEVSCNVTFKATCEVTFSSNLVTLYGAAICSVDDSHVTFTGNAKVTLYLAITLSVLVIMIPVSLYGLVALFIPISIAI